MPNHAHHADDGRSPKYSAGSLSLVGAVSMGTGVMIGAGKFALTSQVAQLAGDLFPLAFLAAAIITSASAYAYVKVASAYPSAGGIAMFLEKAYGRTTITGACALLMYISMVINESLVARTFGTYTAQLFNTGVADWVVTVLAVGLLIFAFVVNILGNRLIQTLSFFMAFLKIAGIAAFGGAGLWISGLALPEIDMAAPDTGSAGFLGAVALAILAYKGFTTITNSGGEIVEPHRNVGRAIVIAIAICVVVYMLVALAVGANLTVEAARPAFGDAGLWFTVAFAVIATVSGLIASVFAVSRMLAMLTEMKLVPHSHFGMPGSIQKHTLVYTIVAAVVLTVFFDLGRIASLGAILYIVMDIFVQWGIFRHLRHEIGASAAILILAIILDAAALSGLIYVKASSDMLVIYAALLALVLTFAGERLFLRRFRQEAHRQAR
jgi:amino acid transporter